VDSGEGTVPAKVGTSSVATRGRIGGGEFVCRGERTSLFLTGASARGEDVVEAADLGGVVGDLEYNRRAVADEGFVRGGRKRMSSRDSTCDG
jgi:hypothetical protein